jgi:hypothetical protein
VYFLCLNGQPQLPQDVGTITERVNLTLSDNARLTPACLANANNRQIKSQAFLLGFLF